MHFNPGEKVRIINDAIEDFGLYSNLYVTKGSTGTILTFADYCDYARKNLKPSFCDQHLPFVEKQMLRCVQFPVRIDSVELPPNDIIDYWRMNFPQFSISCKVGNIEVLHIKYFKKISTIE